ncbi:MAG: hypothetical protein GXP42_09505 [Chloroflexi bacterium]|nr:hypothetical protein [Chloroflexota bacterium]
MSLKTMSWKAIIWSAFLIFFIPFALSFLAIFGYALIMGFQTRGDAQLINESIAGLVSSSSYLGGYALLTALISFWRGRIIAKKSLERASTHILIAVALVILVRLAMILNADQEPGQIALLWFGVESAGALALGYLGSRFGR